MQLHPLLSLTMDRGSKMTGMTPTAMPHMAPTMHNPLQLGPGFGGARDPMQLLAGLLGGFGKMGGIQGGAFGLMQPQMPQLDNMSTLGTDADGSFMPNLPNLDWFKFFSDLFNSRDFFQ